MILNLNISLASKTDSQKTQISAVLLSKIFVNYFNPDSNNNYNNDIQRNINNDLVY